VKLVEMTAATPSREGSVCSILVNTPSVTTSIRVSRETRVSIRIRYPTVAPTPCLSVCAILCATATGSQPPRLEHEQALACHPGLLEQYERHHGALAGARRCLKHDRVV